MIVGIEGPSSPFNVQSIAAWELENCFRHTIGHYILKGKLLPTDTCPLIDILWEAEIY